MDKATNKLLVLWTSNDKETALNMVFMYTKNSQVRGWWDEVNLVIWGASAKLVAEDKEIQEYIKKMIEEGVKVDACKACSDNLGVTEEIEKLGVNVKYVGEPFTKALKEGCRLISV